MHGETVKCAFAFVITLRINNGYFPEQQLNSLFWRHFTVRFEVSFYIKLGWISVFNPSSEDRTPHGDCDSSGRTH
jgi:hypothetical protein